MERKKICMNIKNIPIYILLLFLINEKVLHDRLDENNYIYFYGSAIIFFFLFCLYYKELIYDKYVLILFISQMWILLSDYINGSTYLSMIRTVNTMSLLLVCVYNVKKEMMNFFGIIRNVLLILCIYDQFWTIYQVYILNKSPEGGYGIFLHKNAHVIIYITLIIFWWYLDRQIHNKVTKKLYAYIIFCLYQSIVVLQASSSSVALAILALLIIFGDKIGNKLYNVFTIFLLELFFFIFIVMNRFYTTIISFFLLIVLKRDFSFSGRTLMWDSALTKIRDLPIIGFGDDVSFSYVFQGGDLSNNCHNYILHIIMSGGWIYFFVILLSYFVCHEKMKGFYHKLEAKMILYFLTANLIIGFTEIMVNMSNLIIPFLAMGITIKKWSDNRTDCLINTR